jgi:ubiquinone/menaquinone biosynthesis C-methylase UbiE
MSPTRGGVWNLKGKFMAETAIMAESSDQRFYDQEPLGTEVEHREFMIEISTYHAAYADRLQADLAGREGVVAELGAGSCGLSCCVSRIPGVTKIYSADISKVRMGKMLEMSARILGGDLSKIEPVPCNFNDPLPFGDASLDVVLFDAALHHSRAIWLLLAECNRVLRPGGILIAQREAYLSAFRARKQLAFLLQSPEIAASVSENMYLLEQYSYYLTVAGFEVDFIPWSASKMKTRLKALNGTLFSDGVLYCRKARELPK